MSCKYVAQSIQLIIASMCLGGISQSQAQVEPGNSLPSVDNSPLKRRDLQDVRAVKLTVSVNREESYIDPSEPDPSKSVRSRVKDEVTYNLERNLAARIEAQNPCPDSRIKEFLYLIKPKEFPFNPTPLVEWYAVVNKVTKEGNAYKVQIKIHPRFVYGGTNLNALALNYSETYVVTKNKVRFYGFDAPPVSPAIRKSPIVTVY